jgi:Na+-translocating ferredoxin:NAD+ oxidoreductase RnfC subunit
MLEKSEEIIQGLKLIMRTVSAQKGFIGIEQNKPADLVCLRH